MKAASMEAFLARLYTDEAWRREFLAAPAAVARSAGMDEDAVRSLMQIDRLGLQLAADSYALKRSAHEGKHLGGGLLRRLQRLLMPKRLS